MKQTPLPSLESVAHYFAVWRQNRESKREPIPESLKAMAISLKNRVPVDQIKAALKINSNLLKHGSQDHGADRSPQFLPLPSVETITDTASHTVKLDYPNGLRLSVSGPINNEMLLSLARSLMVEGKS